MHRRLWVWGVRASGAAAVLVAGLLSGWMFRPASPGESSEPVSSETSGDAPQTPVTATVRENRLAKETSPYLQLHRKNPIDWYPWGSEAIERAKREDKLIFLSIGYSSCYWCHVMERESFNDLEIARVLNESFVCIKVDREELPDVDEIFMTFVQISNRGGGGWPLTVFLTPDARPIVGGTYFPPRERRGMPGLFETLGVVLDRWGKNRVELEQQAEAWTRTLQSVNPQRSLSLRPLDRKVVGEAIDDLSREFDQQYGGFGYDPSNAQRPKFPQAPVLGLLNYQVGQNGDRLTASMLVQTLHRMGQGGIWDCVGGGFHRYSVDRFWRVPHFEKMLYDNAQLARVYLEAFALTRDRAFAHIGTRALAFVERELTSREGGFYSALDAESEHEEGKYYVWTREEVQSLLSPHEASVVVSALMGGPPHFPDDRYVLQLGDSLPSRAKQTGVDEGSLASVLEQSAVKLLIARHRRPRPLLDTKILTDWNGLMIAALADGYRLLGEDKYRVAAELGAHFVLSKLRSDNGRLLHVYSAGTAKIPGYLEDYAFLVDGLVALYRATNDEKWLAIARSIADPMHELFWDEATGGFFQTAKDTPAVLTRLKPAEDSSIPSGNSAAALALVRLAQSTGDARYAKRAANVLAAFAGPMARSPGRWPHMVRALGEYLDAGFPRESLAPQGTSEAQVVWAQAIMQQNKLAPGVSFSFDVVLEIDRKWHIYANPPSSPECIPTALDVTSDVGLHEVSVQYPQPKGYRPEGAHESIAVYTDRGRIRVNAKLESNARTGPAEIQLALRYQACNDERCLAPKTIRFSLPIEVIAASESPGKSPSPLVPKDPQ